MAPRYGFAKMYNACRLRPVVLDACRENRLQAAVKRQVAAQAVATGLAPDEPRMSSEMVVYAAKDGEQARDGTEAGHSHFARALPARMAAPGVEINKVLRLVTIDVMAGTQGQQQTFGCGSTPGAEDIFIRRN